MRSMRSLATAIALLVATAAMGADPPIPVARGFVTDEAGVIAPAVAGRLDSLLTELRETTGAEIAVLTVDSTAPLDDFTYAMRVAEAWRPGRKGEDTGLLVLVAVKDRKLRVVTGYGLEGVLPDGLVGTIQDTEMMPSFRAGRIDEGIERGVREFASRIAAEKGVTLTGVPPPRVRGPEPIVVPSWLALLLLLVFFGFLVYVMTRPRRRLRGRRSGWYVPGGFGGGSYGGGEFGGGGGGFGGFGGGSFGGGGAGRSW
jgi:uncharacterized protein